MDSTGNYENREIRRVPMACTICRARKLKCRKAEKHAPSCERCIKDGQECIFVPVSEDMSHFQGHDRSPPGNVLPSYHHYSGTHPPQQYSSATHVPPETAHWPAQSGGRVVDQQPTQYHHSQSNAETSQYSRHLPYWHQQSIGDGVTQPPAHYTPYTGTNTWSAVQPASYDQFAQSSNSVPNAVPTSSAENYSAAYLPPYSQNHATYTAQWAGPSHVHQTYPQLNLVYENPSGYDASGDYESPNRTSQDSVSESNE
ncbi:hypothetical protein HYPSUDRAFT_249282 [Hypholoma sublateritium FD-334 SS-4]|uniref:Zn(2)-C6 fungal-type domain-containing protein n=1 Tax=Hypholoma sublateritium (strain FD-334 SS-4) TaxID=945553 RepID=A0A0D2QEE2_HYPSF|nr:hypothetical protein HYPSUDRAFT_249282 [Hypholoma sublateritium FD-334 SS-4]